MTSSAIQTLTLDFESFVNNTEDNIEFWLARDLQHLLGYTKWDNFKNVLLKAKTACEVSGHEIEHHFADVGKTIQMPKGATKEVDDFMPIILLKAKDFATEITIHNARENSMNSESQISNEHIINNKAVRDTLLSRGIIPEKLSPEEDVKKVERKLNSADKKALKNLDKLKE